MPNFLLPISVPVPVLLLMSDCNSICIGVVCILYSLLSVLLLVYGEEAAPVWPSFLLEVVFEVVFPIPVPFNPIIAASCIYLVLSYISIHSLISLSSAILLPISRNTWNILTFRSVNSKMPENLFSNISYICWISIYV